MGIAVQKFFCHALVYVVVCWGFRISKKRCRRLQISCTGIYLLYVICGFDCFAARAILGTYVLLHSTSAVCLSSSWEEGGGGVDLTKKGLIGVPDDFVHSRCACNWLKKVSRRVTLLIGDKRA